MDGFYTAIAAFLLVGVLVALLMDHGFWIVCAVLMVGMLLYDIIGSELGFLPPSRAPITVVEGPVQVGVVPAEKGPKTVNVMSPVGACEPTRVAVSPTGVPTGAVAGITWVVSDVTAGVMVVVSSAAPQALSAGRLLASPG